MDIQQSTPLPIKSDIFNVTQVTEGTLLEDVVGADIVFVEAHQTSQVHRHNESETVLYILQGSGILQVNDQKVQIKAGLQVCISKGDYHGVITSSDSLTFLSIQSPPILNKKNGTLDFEKKELF